MRRGIHCILLSVALLLVATTNCKNPNLSGGILHFDQKRYERARQTLLKAIQQEPNNAEAYFWLGKAYAELDSTQEARAALEKAAALAGDRFPEMKDDVANALEHYWSLRHNDGLSFAKAAQEARAQGNAKEAQQNFRSSLNQFKRARIYGPQKEETPRNMGVAYFNLGQVDSGLTALHESQELAPAGDKRAADILFTQYRQLGDQAAEKAAEKGEEKVALDDAVKFYTEAEKIRADDADLLFSLGVVHYQLANVDTVNRTADYEKALGYFERMLTIKPDDQEALFNAASLCLELRECDKGVERAKALLSLDPRNYRSYDLVGRLYDCQGKKSERVAGLVFSRALRDGSVQPVDDFRGRLEKLGAQADFVRKYREEGKPEEVRTFTDSGGHEYECWFYWTRGRAYAFTDGSFKYETSFKAVQLKEQEGTDKK